jgi:hypothetical protein
VAAACRVALPCHSLSLGQTGQGPGPESDSPGGSRYLLRAVRVGGGEDRPPATAARSGACNVTEEPDLYPPTCTLQALPVRTRSREANVRQAA